MRKSLSEHGLSRTALSAILSAIALATVEASCDDVRRRIRKVIRRGSTKVMLAKILRQIGAGQLAFLGLILFPPLRLCVTPHDADHPSPGQGLYRKGAGPAAKACHVLRWRKPDKPHTNEQKPRARHTTLSLLPFSRLWALSRATVKNACLLRYPPPSPHQSQSP